MAGAILVSDKNGVSLNSLDFDYIIEKIRPHFQVGEELLREEIYSPVDEGGMSFISLKEQSDEGFKAFLRATSLALEHDEREQAFSARKKSWEELVMMLRADPRAR